MHLWLASQLKENPSASYLFGNLLPDVEHLMKPPEELIIDGQHQGSGHTHKEQFLASFNGNIREGIRIHFMVDEYIHTYYIPKKIKQFSRYDPGLVHFLTEIVMDRVLIEKRKDVLNLFDQVAANVKLDACGKELEVIFPRSKYPGSVVLKDGLEMLRVNNLTSYFKMFKVRKIVRRYNPFKHIDPNAFKVYVLFKKLEKEVRKDIDNFMEDCLAYVKEKITSTP